MKKPKQFIEQSDITKTMIICLRKYTKKSVVPCKNKGDKYQIFFFFFIHKLISTGLIFIKSECKRRFPVSWLLGKKIDLYSQKNQEWRKYVSVAILKWKQKMKYFTSLIEWY